MKTKIIFLFFLGLLFQTNSVEAQKRRSVPKPKTLTARQIADKVLPSVVLIITQDENGNPISQGSGFVYKPGLVVSNLHVFERATNAIVKNVKTGEISKAAEVVAMNARQDICVIRITNTKFPVLSLGDSHAVRTGDDIYVASNPKGLEGSFTKGIVSSVRESERSNKGDDEIIAWAKNFTDQTDRTLFQIDAAISPGSSGGAVVNTKGEVVGIVRSSLTSGQNLNFAIPIEQLKTISMKFNHPIQLAGACAYRAKDRDKLKGLVKSVTEKSTYKTRKDGRIIETGPVTNSISIYDLEGNKIESHIYSVEGNFAWKSIFKYDENRLKTAIIQEESNGQQKETTFSLDAGIHDKLYNRRFSGSIGAIDKQGGMQVFDRDGNMVTWYVGGRKFTYQYDSEGRAIQRATTRYRYKEDRNGNWIEQKQYMNFPNDPDFDPNEWVEIHGATIYREITYYG